MKHFFVALLLFNALLSQGESKDDARTRTYKMVRRSAFKAIKDMAEFVKANRRGDLIWTLVKLIDVYDKVIKIYPLPLSSFFVHLFQKFLKKIHPLYLRVFPSKRPTNETLVADIAGSISHNFNSFVKDGPQQIPGGHLASNSLSVIGKPVNGIIHGVEGTLAKGIGGLIF